TKNEMRRIVFSNLSRETQQPPNIDDVSRHLPLGVLFIDFVRYGRDTGEDSPIAPHYGAVVYKPGRSASWVSLGPAQPIDDMIARYEQLMRGKADESYATVTELLGSLWHSLWEPLGVRDDISTALISPDGRLHAVSFSTLWTGERFVAQDVDVCYVA